VNLPASQGKNKQALKNKIIFAYCVDVKQQKIDLFQLSTTEILNKVYKYKIIARIIENITSVVSGLENPQRACNSLTHNKRFQKYKEELYGNSSYLQNRIISRA
jgi:hypothetical protein